MSTAKFFIPYCTLHRIFHQLWNKVYFSDICLLRRRNLRHSKTWVSPTLENIILCNISWLKARQYLSSYSWGMLTPTWVLMHAIVLIACKLWFRDHPSLKLLRSFHRLLFQNIIQYLQLLQLSPSCRPLCRFDWISRFLIHLKRSGPFSLINPMLFHHILFVVNIESSLTIELAYSFSHVHRIFNRLCHSLTPINWDKILFFTHLQKFVSE